MQQSSCMKNLLIGISSPGDAGKFLKKILSPLYLHEERIYHKNICSLICRGWHRCRNYIIYGFDGHEVSKYCFQLIIRKKFKSEPGHGW